MALCNSAQQQQLLDCLRYNGLVLATGRTRQARYVLSSAVNAAAKLCAASFRCHGRVGTFLASRLRHVATFTRRSRTKTESRAAPSGRAGTALLAGQGPASSRLARPSRPADVKRLSELRGSQSTKLERQVAATASLSTEGAAGTQDSLHVQEHIRHHTWKRRWSLTRATHAFTHVQFSSPRRHQLWKKRLGFKPALPGPSRWRRSPSGLFS